MFSMHKVVGAALCILAGLTAVSGAELVLAEGGTTAYRVVAPKSPSPMERAAVADLTVTLREITGADFSSAAGKDRRIFVGVRPPCDREPLRENERRVTSHDGDIYLYGEGKYGNARAVYDFLRDELGCRWFNSLGDKRIPKNPRLVLAELKKSIVPSIPVLTLSYGAHECADWVDFTRRNGIMDGTFDHVGPRGHSAQQIIPSGRVAAGKPRVGLVRPPYKYFEDKKYLETNPEFFSMDKQGNRVMTMQLCYSNMAMRDEYERNMRIIFEKEHYDGLSTAVISLGQDDNGGAFCFCPNCKALEKKYDHPAGAYYDFLLDMSKRFEKTHPKLVITFHAYRDEQTLVPAECLKNLPANLLPGYAPLGADFSKPYTHPNNRVQSENFERWSRISKRLRWSVYPTTYLYPITAYPLVADLHRLVENFRYGRDHKVWMAFCEFGYGSHDNFGFNDLRLYLLAELSRDADLDEQKLVTEFTDCCYGPAAPMVRKYIAELEKLERESKFFLRWNPDILSIPYVTGANLIRWDRDFDAMEKLVADDPRLLFNVRRTRWVLDETVVAKWPYLTPEERKALGDLDRRVERLKTVLLRANEAQLASMREADPAHYQSAMANRLRPRTAGLDNLVALARGGKPLPERLAKRKVYRLLPTRHRKPLDIDPDAAFGVCNKGVYPKKGSWFNMRRFNAGKPLGWESLPLPKPFGGKSIKHATGKYRFYYLGTMTIAPDSQLSISPISFFAGFSLGHLHDPKRPNRLFNFVVSLAVDPDKKWVKVDQLLVFPTDRDEKPGTKHKTNRDVVDSFV